MPDETHTIDRLKQADDILDRFIATLAQYDISHTTATALTLQLFGGVERTQNARPIRSQIHLAIIVPSTVNVPGLADHLSRLAPNAACVNASNATYTGLTGPVRSYGPDKGWYLDAGILTDSEHDYVAIQHPGDLEDKILNCLTEAIGNGGITISKKGYHNTVSVKASFLFIDTPTYGDWDEYETIRNQIQLTPELYGLLDVVVPDIDGPDRPLNAPPIDTDTAQRYIKDAQRLAPTLPDHIRNDLFEALVEIHIEHLNQSSVPHAARNTIRRLAEASAKARYSEEVSRIDAARAITVYRHQYEAIEGLELKPDNDLLQDASSYEAPLIESDEDAQAWADAQPDEPHPSETDTTDIDWDLIPGLGPSREEKQRRHALKQIFAEADGPLTECEVLKQAGARGLSERETLVLLGELRAEYEIDRNQSGNWHSTNY